MFSSIANAIFSSLSDMMQNPISITVFGLLLVIVIALTIAIFSSSWRDLLIKIKLLEEDEEPSSLLIWIVGIIIIVELVKGFLVQPFIVDGDSMIPTYHNQEFLLVDKLSYRINEPERGDIVIFRLYENLHNPYEGKYLIKRIIAKPGERVVIRNGITTVYNKQSPNGFTIEEPFVAYKDTQKNVDTTLSETEYFVMGDNRAKSYDSRDWGPLDVGQIKGQVLFRIYPFDVAGYEPGRYIFNK
jgi:signal peptidase I